MNFKIADCFGSSDRSNGGVKAHHFNFAFQRWDISKIILLILFLGIFLSPQIAITQPILTKSDAVKRTLENNFDIKIATNNIAISENNADRRNNGYLPSVNATAGTNASFTGSNIKFESGDEVSNKNAFAWRGNASVGANYTLFDKARDANLEQLKAVIDLTDLQKRQTIELNISQLMSAYYEVARLTENLKVFEQTIDVSRQRLTRAQYRFEYGQGIRLDVLNAEVDIQRDSINYLNIQQQLANAQRNLNVIMGQSINTPFQVDTIANYAQNISFNQLLTNSKTKNIAVLMMDKNLGITQMDFQIIDAQRKPTVSANASYDFSFSDSQPVSPFSPTFNTSRGLGAGVNLNWNLFDGGRRKIQEQNIQISVENQQVQKEQLLLELERDLANSWQNYQTALYILDAEKGNLKTAELNLERTNEQFKIGQISSVEFRQAQLNLLNAATSFNTAKYDAKAIEVILFQLSGQLLEVPF